MDFSVEDARPLGAAVLSLLTRYPVVITYEDPRYQYSGDLQDVTERVRRNPNSTGKGRILVPRGGHLHASYEIAQETGTPVNMKDALNGVVAAKNLNAVGGRFAVYQSGDALHVVPVEVRDSNGAWVKQQSVLNTPITLSSGELDGYALMEAILKEVSDASGIKLGLAAENVTNTLGRYRGGIEAADEPARDVLLRALHSISPRLTWILNYDPSDRYYFFNVTVVAEPPPPEVPLDLSTLPRPGDPTPAGPPFRAR